MGFLDSFKEDLVGGLGLESKSDEDEGAIEEIDGEPIEEDEPKSTHEAKPKSNPKPKKASASDPEPEPQAELEETKKQPSSLEGDGFKPVPGHKSDERQAENPNPNPKKDSNPDPDPDPKPNPKVSPSCHAKRNKDGKIRGFSDEELFSYVTSPKGIGEFFAHAAGLDCPFSEEMKALSFALSIWYSEQQQVDRAEAKAEAAHQAEIEALKAELKKAKKAQADAEAKAKKADAFFKAMSEALK